MTIVLIILLACVIILDLVLIFSRKPLAIEKEDWIKLYIHEELINILELRIKGIEQRTLFLENYRNSKREQEKIARQILEKGSGSH